jgi:hypothetical protein
MAWSSKIITIYLMSILIEATLATLDEDTVFGFVSTKAIASFCHVAYRDR